MPYTKHEDGSATLFSVEPETIPSFVKSFGLWKLIIISGIIFAFPFFAMGSPLGAVVVLAIFISIGRFYSKKFNKSDVVADAMAHREASTFRVSNSAIAKNGQTFQVKDIHRIIIRNPLSDQGSVVVFSGNASQAAGHRAGMAIKRKRAEVSYFVDLESGGSATTLAGGLTETAAFGLAKDIQTITGLDFYH